jgi:hypothetical protein
VVEGSCTGSEFRVCAFLSPDQSGVVCCSITYLRFWRSSTRRSVPTSPLAALRPVPPSRSSAERAPQQTAPRTLVLATPEKMSDSQLPPARPCRNVTVAVACRPLY